jgi:hypothetical protein
MGRDREIDMQKLLLWPAVVLALLVGCSSFERAPLEPPQVIGGDANGPMAEVQVSLSDGAGIAALLNKNYNETTTSCTQSGTGLARGYYWCTGVLVRTTDDGAFNPWESSPTALRLHGTSYSWIRHDLQNAGLFKPAGYVILSPADAAANTVPGVTSFANAVQCVYPLDAWTQRTMDRSHIGCDFEGTGLTITYSPWGSCENRLGYSNSAQWNARFESQGRVIYRQCSWGADNQQGWRNMIASHNIYTGISQHNEVMLTNWGGTSSLPQANEQYRESIPAFFYDVAKPGGLAIAQSFQRKMFATGRRVPILRLSFTAAAAQRFQFQQADQVAGQYP